MSNKAVLIWLLLAIALGTLTVLLLRSGPAGASPNATPGALAVGEKLFDFAPSAVQSISVAHPDGTTDLVERRAPDFESPIGSDAEWFVRTTKSSSPTSQPPPLWPLTGPSVQGLLRTLADVRAISLPDREASLGTGPTIVTITLRDGGKRTLRLADRTLAGAGLIELTSPTPTPPGGPDRTLRAIVNDELHRVFTNPGPRAWRDRNFMAGLSTDASRIRLENPRQRIALGKTNAQWSMREPVPAPADPAAVQKLLSTLGRISIDDFLDLGAPGASTGLESPSARIELEADRRSIADSGEVNQKTARLDLAIGSPADTTSRRLFASIAGQYLVLLDSRGLDTLSLDPGTYIWPYATRTPAADIGIIILARGTPDSAGTPAASAASSMANRSVLKRSGPRWVHIQPDGLEMMLAEQDLKDADALVSFLCGSDQSPTPAPTNAAPVPGRDSSPKIEISQPENFRTLASIELRSLADAPLETIEAGSVRPATLTLKTGQVYRTWPLNKVPPMLAAFIATPEPAPSPGPEPEPQPEMK